MLSLIYLGLFGSDDIQIADGNAGRKLHLNSSKRLLIHPHLSPWGTGFGWFPYLWMSSRALLSHTQTIDGLLDPTGAVWPAELLHPLLDFTQVSAFVYKNLCGCAT